MLIAMGSAFTETRASRWSGIVRDRAGQLWTSITCASKPFALWRPFPIFTRYLQFHGQLRQWGPSWLTEEFRQPEARTYCAGRHGARLSRKILHYSSHVTFNSLPWFRRFLSGRLPFSAVAYLVDSASIRNIRKWKQPTILVLSWIAHGITSGSVGLVTGFPKVLKVSISIRSANPLRMNWNALEAVEPTFRTFPPTDQMAEHGRRTSDDAWGLWCPISGFACFRLSSRNIPICVSSWARQCFCLAKRDFWSQPLTSWKITASRQPLSMLPRFLPHAWLPRDAL